MTAHVVRLTHEPLRERVVDDATFDDLTAQRLVLEPTRATTDAGLIAAATTQVREANYDEATRAGIAEAAAKATAQKNKKPRAAPGASRSRRGRQAAATDPAGTPAAGAPATADGTPTGDQASADVAVQPSGDAPADTTQES